MVSRTFLTDFEVSRLEHMERIFVWFRQGGWVTLLALWLLITACLGLLVYSRAREVTRLATQTVPAEVLLFDNPKHGPVTGAQASASLRFAVARSFLLMLPGFLLVSIFVAHMAIAPSIAAWRTIKALTTALSDIPSVGNVASAYPFQFRPPARGLQTPRNLSRLSGKPWLLPDERANLYRSERKVAWRMRWYRIVFLIMMPAVVAIPYAQPVYVALMCGVPSYSGYMRLVTGYEPLKLYNLADLMLARMTALCFVWGGLMLLYVLGLATIYRMLTDTRCGRNTRATLIAEMRRLDVLLWRKSRAKAV